MNSTARARETFLSDSTPIDAEVRRTVLASWRRSRVNHVHVDRIEVPYVDDRDRQTRLLACATPILDYLYEQLGDEPVSAILTDRAGVVLSRRTTSRELVGRLDAVSLAPGFSYAEKFVGTNGIGTTIASGQSTLVDGSEHYSGPLGQFACTGVPILHPTRQTTLGVLNLTSWAQGPARILMALAKATAREIEDELLAQTGTRELALFQEYMRACQQSGGPVLAINSDALMMNDHLRQALGADEQRTLTEFGTEALRSDDGVATYTVVLPSGRTAGLRRTPVESDAGGAGAVFRVRLLQSEAHQQSVKTRRHSTRPLLAPSGLVGTSAAWLRCVQEVSSCYEGGEWLALSGEGGTGKRSLLRAVHRQHNPTHGFRVLEPPNPGGVDSWLSALSEALSDTPVMVVITGADRLGEECAAALADQVVDLAADSDPSRHVRVAITTTASAAQADSFASAFPHTIEVPPLRHHIDDLRELVLHLLAQLTNDSRVSLSHQAVAQLSRLDWPGNVTQLHKLLASVIRSRRSGVIEVGDLPVEARTSAHRRLTTIEALERDAIVQSLLDNSQRPSEAAEALGISRATIYRRLRQFGISLPIVR